MLVQVGYTILFISLLKYSFTVHIYVEDVKNKMYVKKMNFYILKTQSVLLNLNNLFQKYQYYTYLFK